MLTFLLGWRRNCRSKSLVTGYNLSCCKIEPMTASFENTMSNSPAMRGHAVCAFRCCNNPCSLLVGVQRESENFTKQVSKSSPFGCLAWVFLVTKPSTNRLAKAHVLFSLTELACGARFEMWSSDGLVASTTMTSNPSIARLGRPRREA